MVGLGLVSLATDVSSEMVTAVLPASLVLGLHLSFARTGVLDLQSGRVITTLEDFTIDGKKLPIDANFWGISFAGDDNTFYSTMATGDHLYLVRGDFAAGDAGDHG